MLTQETKRKIDSARQILVGKVPDPKAQVEQITTALIYKFMDDMDKEAQELGGKARFFTSGYQKYAWTKLMDAKLGGHERLDLYLEAITSLSRNPHIPQLFRDIFKDAFLPYRSPETLSMFLKEINGFTYEHSEDLGDAFEYLLSILGSQGDAGQFRTPRHIIDFIVAAVDPKKGETICDPACGTAGFLISAFKHILKENKEKSLTPDERKNLMDHFVGYDISPDMVRLSKVNLYLHGFPSPTIFEYDTLSSEEKWDENFDVMLANPPFMSPSGGIRPHKRFSVQANRSEVLFVDYILEHLRPNGRAGIIVPEGIIFQSATAYKALRKLLIEDGLLAVVSLPAGVFNPYAGVKTSILLFDNGLAKKTKEILFLKIQNDGYGLGAQRREIDKNDLPLALETIKKFRVALKDSKKFVLNAEQAKIAHLVVKDKIAESGDYNLSGDRYMELVNFANQKWPMVELGKVCEIYQPKTITSKEIKQTGKYKVFGANGVIGFYDRYNHEDAEVLITCRGATCGTVNMSESKSWITGNAMVVKPKDNLDKNFLFYFLRNTNLKSVISGSAQPQITRASLSPFKIPLPPLEVQKEIVEQIEVKQKAIEAAKAVIDNLERERDAILAKRLEK
ncbi:MAG: N-6 DNA methylase [Patescibacteria group bacterium]|nr:N-6 DNA methylase [Patescibacteria group bacterium]